MKLARLKEWREAHGLTQKELANSAGASEWTITRAEAGEEVRVNTARRLAGVLDVAVADLMESPPVPLAGAPSTSPEAVEEEPAAALAGGLFDKEELQRYEQGDLLNLKNELLDEYNELHPGPRTKEDFFRPESPEERAQMDRFIVVSANLGAVLSVLEETAGPQHA
jgi:transcriptional regulator with XRE-family HTH domain